VEKEIGWGGGGFTLGTTSKCSVQVTMVNTCNVTRCSVTILEIRGLPADDWYDARCCA